MSQLANFNPDYSSICCRCILHYLLSIQDRPRHGVPGLQWIHFHELGTNSRTLCPKAAQQACSRHCIDRLSHSGGAKHLVHFRPWYYAVSFSPSLVYIQSKLRKTIAPWTCLVIWSFLPCLQFNRLDLTCSRHSHRVRMARSCFYDAHSWKTLCLESAAHFHTRSYKEGILFPLFALSTRLSAVTSTSSLSCLYQLCLLFSCGLFFSSTNTPSDFENVVLYLFSH